MLKSRRSLALGAALISAGCSLGDFGYLSAEHGNGKAGTSALGGAAGGVGGAGRGAGGNGARSGDAPNAGNGGSAGGRDSAGNGGSAGSGGNDVQNQFFCDPKYAVFDATSGGAPPVELPESGNYVLHKQDTPRDCLVTPDWPELADKRYWAIAHECGGPGSANAPAAFEIWHLEHLCSDVYRFTVNHGSDAERQLGLVSQADVGTPLYSVPSGAAAPANDPANDPSLLFHLRFEELLGEVVRWRFSPVIQSSSCVEDTGSARYGDLDVMRVVLYPCTGSLNSQSWNLLPIP